MERAYRFISDCTWEFRAFLITFIPSSPSGIPVYSPHLTSLINIFNASDHNHLLSLPEAEVEKSGRKLFTKTWFIICHITDSCWVVALQFPGPSLYGKPPCVSDGKQFKSTLNSKGSSGCSDVQPSFSSSLTGLGSFFSLSLCPNSVWTWNHIRDYANQDGRFSKGPIWTGWSQGAVLTAIRPPQAVSSAARSWHLPASLSTMSDTAFNPASRPSTLVCVSFTVLLSLKIVRICSATWAFRRSIPKVCCDQGLSDLLGQEMNVFCWDTLWDYWKNVHSRQVHGPYLSLSRSFASQISWLEKLD